MRIVLLAAFLLVGSAVAAPFAIQLGDTRLGLDAPPGFADTGFTGSPRLQELAESLTSASNRILLFAISDADLRRFTLGDAPELRRYMIAVTPKGLERERVSPAAFGAFVRDSLAALGSAPAPVDRQEVRNAVEQANKEITNRFDFKGSDARVELSELLLTVYADDEFKLNQVMDVLRARLAKRNVDVRCLEPGSVERISGDKLK